MTKKELIEKLASFPDNMEVFIHGGKEDEYLYGISNSVYKKELTFCEDPDLPLRGQIHGKDTVIIIDEE